MVGIKVISVPGMHVCYTRYKSYGTSLFLICVGIFGNKTMMSVRRFYDFTAAAKYLSFRKACSCMQLVTTTACGVSHVESKWAYELRRMHACMRYYCERSQVCRSTTYYIQFRCCDEYTHVVVL